MKTRLLSTLLSISLSAVLWQLPHLAWSETLAHNPTLTVIGYHEITNRKNALIPEYAVSTTHFKQHIAWLKNNGFHFISVDQLIQANQGQSQLPAKPVLLTVDDGYASFYQNAYPIIKANNIPVVLAVVGSWLEPKQGQNIDFSGKQIQRNEMLSWSELKEMQDSGLVEIANHSYNLHRGILGNPQGNLESAAVTRLYDPQTASYENDQHYQKRIFDDLKRNNQLLTAHGLKAPRVMVWPYGHYNMQTVNIAKQLGMSITISLNDGADSAKSSLGQLNRILVEGDMSITDLAQEIKDRQQNLGDNNRPQKIMHIDLDYIYDQDPAQQERNLDHLLDRIVEVDGNTVYLQAFSDPDANGSADMVYFPNRYLPMRADLFNRVAWQIQSRTQVSRIYAWMPLLAWELPKNNPAAQDRVETQPTQDAKHLDMGYHRLRTYPEYFLCKSSLKKAKLMN